MKKRKSEKWAVTRICFLSIAILISSCGNQHQYTLEQPAPIETTRMVEDDLGRQVSVPLKITRAISLAPSLTEMIFAVGAGGRLVGVTTYCNYPLEAQKIQKVSDTQTPNIENIIALKPQIVFVSTASQLEAFMQTLESQDISVFVTNPKDLEGVLSNLRQLGNIFGETENAGRVVTELSGRLNLVRRDVDIRFNEQNRPRVFVQISNEPLFTIGNESFLTEIINQAGGDSVTGDLATAYPKLSKETAIAMNPDVIILSDSDDNKEPNAVFRNSNAVKNGGVFRINADIISRPGPRLVIALEQIAEVLNDAVRRSAAGQPSK